MSTTVNAGAERQTLSVNESPNEATLDTFDQLDLEFQEKSLTIKSIGRVGTNEGSNEYVLLKRRNDDLSPELASAWLLRQVYADSSHPGGYFCRSVNATKDPYSEKNVLCVIQHRYDI